MFNKEIVRTITHSWGRFIAIFAIVALGVGFYAGLRMTAPDMRLAADAFYDETSLMDIRVVSTMGLTEEDIDELRAIDGVETVMPAYETDVVAELDNEPYSMRVHSLPYNTKPSNVLDANSENPTVDIATDADQEDTSTVDSNFVTAISQDEITAALEGSINQLILEEGVWPTSDDECILSVDRIMNSPISLGDKLTVKECTTGLDDTLNEREYRVVGLAHSSYYASSTSMGSTTLGTGLIQQFMYVPSSDFRDSFPITEAFITVEGAKDLLSASFDYDSRVDEVIKEIEGISADREAARYASIKNDAQNELDDARKTYESERNDAYAALDDAKAKLDDADSQLSASRVQIAQGEREYASGKSELESQKSSGNAKLAEAQAQIDANRATLDASKQTLEQEKAKLDQGWASLASYGVTPENASDKLVEYQGQLDNLPAGTPDSVKHQLETLISSISQMIAGQNAYDAGLNQYNEGIAKLALAQSQLDSEKKQAAQKIADAEAQLRSAASQLNSGREKLASGEKDYQDGLASYESERDRAERELADAEKKIADAQAEIDDIKMPEWLILDRSKNYGAESFDMDAGRIDNIAMVFPFVFFLVAALVALTTMTRMVDEERMQIGTYKALGYSRSRITSKYIIYAGIASLFGSVVGIAALAFSLPAIIMSAYAIVYIVPIQALAIDWPIAIIATVLGIGITLFATMAAAISTLRESPSALMQPKAPKAGKKILLERIPALWNHLSFLWKVTCRNIFRYKKRLFMTIIGIAGCTALLLTGFGLQDSINDIIDKHYGEIIEYNTIVMTDDESDDSERDNIVSAIESSNLVDKFALTQNESMKIVGDASDLSVEVVVPEKPDEFNSIWEFRERLSHDPVGLNNEGAVLTEKAATRFGVSVGDSVSIATQDDMGNATNDIYQIPVAGIIESYIGHDIFMTSDLYREVFDQDINYNNIFLKLNANDNEREDFADYIRELDGVKTVGFNDETIDMYKTALKSVNMVVIVLIIAAALLAFIVLYNLTNINITERMREIATLEVLGFTSKEVNQYIFREILILSIIGALFGLLLGIFLENFVVTTAEVDAVMFGREIHWPSYVFAFVLTMLFTVIVSFSMRGKLKKIDMVSSLKSNE